MQQQALPQLQLHIQLPQHNYMHMTHPDRSVYANMPGTPDGVESCLSGDESASDRKAREMAPFLRNLRNMLDRESPEVLRWSKDGTAFEIHDMDEMMNTVLPKYFKHKKYTSFQRQLNYFNFKKWTKSRANVCTFSNEFFTRHEPYRSTLITRKKSISSQKESNGDESEDGCGTPRGGCNDLLSGSSKSVETASKKVKKEYHEGQFSCDSPLQIKKDLLVISNGSLDNSFQSMNLQKKSLNQAKGLECFAPPYENKHLTRVMGKKSAPKKISGEEMQSMQFNDDLDWISDSDFENIRDSVSSLTSTHSGEWDDSDMNWVDLLPYNDPSYFEPENSENYMRQQFVPVNNINFYAAAI
jgi:hypothetical protein